MEAQSKNGQKWLWYVGVLTKTADAFLGTCRQHEYDLATMPAARQQVTNDMGQCFGEWGIHRKGVPQATLTC
jgi:hypothetical protein